MNVSVQQLGDWFAVVTPEGPLRTPMGTPVVSRHRALAEEVAADVARWGSDPTAKTTTLSLQASYLDFGLRVKREVLEENTAAIWPNDLFVQRPADPRVAAALDGLWGPAPLERPRFREALRGMTLRQVVACMTAGHVLRSAVLGAEAVATGRDLVPLTRGACGRHYDALVRALDGGSELPGARRHVPSDMDEACCDACCRALGRGVETSFPERCALHPLLEKLRRWSAWGEEAEKR
jgi:hypothetical protein